MKPENKLALVIAYYLSRYDRKALTVLGYKSFMTAARTIGGALKVNPNTIKNMRDEFDSVYGETRAGWHQRPLRPSRLAVAEILEPVSEQGLGSLVKDILHDPKSSLTDNLAALVNDISSREKKGPRVFVPRNIVGRKAEEIFLNEFKENKTPFSGILKDMRDYGAGFDFSIASTSDEHYIEVKGFSQKPSATTFTDKEWAMAQKFGDKYHLVVVSDIDTFPKLNFVKDPANKYFPDRYISSVITVTWAISIKQLTDSL